MFTVLFFLLFSFFISNCHSVPIKVTKLTKAGQKIVLLYDKHENTQEFQELRGLRNSWLFAACELAKRANPCTFVIEELRKPWDEYNSNDPVIKNHQELEKFLEKRNKKIFMTAFRHFKKNNHLLADGVDYHDASSFSRRIKIDLLKAFTDIENSIKNDEICWCVELLYDASLRKIRITDYCDNYILGPTRFVTWKQVLDSLLEVQSLFARQAKYSQQYLYAARDTGKLIAELEASLKDLGIDKKEQAIKPIVEMFFESMVIAYTGKPSIYGPKNERYTFIKDFFSTKRSPSTLWSNIRPNDFLDFEVDARMLDYVLSAEGKEKPYIFIVGGAFHLEIVEEYLIKLGYQSEEIASTYAIGNKGEKYSFEEFIRERVHHQCKVEFFPPEGVVDKILSSLVVA